ncbi:FAD-dependent oxidoreductase [Pseudomonas mediterranea]|uniref:FAD-dependent oxidoreductase n=1 Tax=Pseudomonas mediterranea TaxID=183795 RepID=UPI0030B8D582
MIGYGSRIYASYDDNIQLSQDIKQDFRRPYTHLSNVTITHSWCGPVDQTFDSLPVVGHLKGATNIEYGIGWSGNGVGPSRLGGRILASLALGLEVSEATADWSVVNRNCFHPAGGLMVRNAAQGGGRSGQSQPRSTGPCGRWPGVGGAGRQESLE